MRVRAAMRSFDPDIVAIFFRDKPCFIEVADNVRPDQNDQFGFSNRIVFVGDGAPDQGNVAQQGNLTPANRPAVLNKAAENKNIVIVDDDAGLDFPLPDGG